MRRPDQQTTTRPTADHAPGTGTDATGAGATVGTPPDGAAPRTSPDGAAERGRTARTGPSTPRTAPVHPAGDPTTEAALAPYLRGQAADFLRSLRLHHEHSAPAESGGHDAAAATRALRRAARRISGSLHTFRVALDPHWADQLRAELAWLSGVLAREHAYAGRLTRLVEALHQLSGPALPAARGARATGDSAASDAQGRAALGVGAARAGALLERRLTLARTRSHSAALQALGSSRFHAVADAVALLASDVPLAPGTSARTAEALLEPAEHAEQRLLAAVAALPPADSEPYNEAQDAAWHQARLLLRLHRYAHEVVLGAAAPALAACGHALDLHRDAVEAAAAAATAARTPRIAPATAYALGVLHADQRHEVEAARSRFRETWPYATALTAS
ncbi:CHAD domain-containing protein [Streptomyces sp. NPDC007027]|uniref:CHAD domain-containing protein n=1 Tax=Streptomyces sp. NPDC007027 TaxID=3157086 RepID=UPI003451E0BB